MLTLCASELNRRVELQRLVESDDGTGGRTSTWVKVCDAWAKMRPGRGAEFMRHGQISATTYETITIRYLSGLSERWRVVYKGRTFNIRDVANIDEADRFLELLCEEGVAS